MAKAPKVLDKNSVYAELSAAASYTPEAGQTKADYMVKLVAKANQLEDDDFDKLSEGARNWFNAAGVAINAKKLESIPELDGMPVLEGAQPTTDAPKGKGKKEDTVKKDEAKKDAKKAMTKDTPPAPAPKAAKAGAAKRGRAGAYALDAAIKVLVKDNPKREGTRAHKMYPKYATSKTVGDYLKAGGQWSDLRWDAEKKFISIGK